MDGLAVVTLRPSVVAQHLMSHADVAPGAVMAGKVHQVNDKGVIVALTTNIKCALQATHARHPLFVSFYQDQGTVGRSQAVA